MDYNDPYNNGTPQNSNPQPASPYRYSWQGSAYGQSLANSLRQNWHDYTGQNADDDLIWNQYLNWDKAPDANFASKLRSQMYNSQQAQDYRNSQNQPAPTQGNPSAPTPPPTSGGGNGATGSPVTDTGKIAPAAPPKPVYTAQTPLPQAYQPGQISQFQAPDQSAPNGQMSALMQSILQNPHTLNDNVIAQMKEQQKEQALQMMHEQQGVLDSNAVARGTVGGGANDALAHQNLMDTIGKILSGNRGVDMQAASQNRQDELNALTAGDSLLNNQLQRATQSYGATLQGQQARESAAQAAAGSGLNLYNADLATELGRNNQNLDVLRYLENMRQFNNTLGFNYNQLDSNTQAAILASILQGSR